jgi:hypothetical protein
MKYTFRALQAEYLIYVLSYKTLLAEEHFRFGSPTKLDKL